MSERLLFICLKLNDILTFFKRGIIILNKIYVLIAKKVQLYLLFIISFQGRILIVKVLTAFIIATYFTYSSYQSTNNPLNEPDVNSYIDLRLKFFSQNFEKNKKEEQESLNNVFLINVSNDKELITALDNRGYIKGDLAITHRGKLAEFLKLTNNTHKFILLDILFYLEHNSKYDSILFSQLRKTKRVLIPSFMNKDSLIQRNELSETGFSGYKSTFNNFRLVKYNFIKGDTIKSIALKMYEALDKKTIIKNKYIDSSSQKIALSSLILNQRIGSVKKYLGEERGYYELGNDLLDSFMKDAIPDLVKDKIVLIGDFEDADLHLTAKGIIPGVLINYNAYLALKNNEHIISNSLIIFLFLGYFGFISAVFFGLKKLLLTVIEKTLTRYLYIDKILIKSLNNNVLKLAINVLSVFLDTIAFLFILSSLIYFIFNIHLDILHLNIEIMIIVLIIIYIIEMKPKKTKKCLRNT